MEDFMYNYRIKEENGVFTIQVMGWRWRWSWKGFKRVKDYQWVDADYEGGCRQSTSFPAYLDFTCKKFHTLAGARTRIASWRKRQEKTGIKYHLESDE